VTPLETKRVVILQHAAVEKPGTIADVLTSAGYSIRPVRAFEGQPVPRNIKDSEGLVIMGGPMGVYERDRHPYFQDEMRLIENALEAGKPVLGICLGSQLLAAVLGADIRRGREKEIGWRPVMLTEDAKDDPLLARVSQPFVALHWHGDVFDLPQGTVHLASSAMTECQAFRYRDAAYGFMFHMEVDEGIVQGMARIFANELSEAGLKGEEIVEGASKHLPGLRQTGRTVFERWSKCLSDGQQPGANPSCK
jgi:GMP synthase (glutamine-hydrolysing)